MRARASALLVVVALVFVVVPAGTQPSWLGRGEQISDGVDYFTTTDQSLVDPPSPIALYLLKLNPSRIRLVPVHAHDEIMGTETVDSIARRHDAVAAINGGFFNLTNGDPVSVLKIGGELVSDAVAIKGAAIIESPPRGKTSLTFDQIAVRLSLTFKAGGREWMLPIDGVDTTRARGKVMLYTPSYHADSDTAPTGTEWQLGGTPMKVIQMRASLGHTPIPRDGLVVSYGGLLTRSLDAQLAAEPVAPTMVLAALNALQPGTKVTVAPSWRTVNGTSEKRLNRADAIVNGAGLLRRDGRVIADWQVENLSPQNFINMRHPRTLIGVDKRGSIWMAAIDGRQPGYSIGMTFADLQRLCDRLELNDALNLDGGGSTTMVARGTIMNKPSDAAGPRPVSDAILVLKR